MSIKESFVARGLLILNLGTPDSPEPDDVGRYLKEFLMDKWVVDIAWPLRWFFVNVVIVPHRKFASSLAYKTIWTERGSPLLSNLRDLLARVKPRVPELKTAVAMRYGNPSIEQALRELSAEKVDEILVFPLYPQYAESSTRSSEEECRKIAKRLGLRLRLRFVHDYFDHPAFIESFAERIRPTWDDREGGAPDHLLMSFHGLPERHVKKTDPSGKHCLASKDCCAQITEVNRNCYRAQSFATARLIAQKLGLTPDQYSVSFQSRLGRTPWIQPFTDEVLVKLAKEKGVRHLAVVCPSFTADCLETIEEIGDRGKDIFLKSGGQKFSRIACLNSDDRWADALVQIAREHQNKPS